MSTTHADADTVTEVLTIDEAAAILRISRNAAYAAARQWRSTGGEHGLPCIEIGRTLRVPRADLDRLLGHVGGSDAVEQTRPCPPAPPDGRAVATPSNDNWT